VRSRPTELHERSYSGPRARRAIARQRVDRTGMPAVDGGKQLHIRSHCASILVG